MNIITVDFETLYTPTYSLSKMTTEEYVRHADFEVIGVGVKVNDGRTQSFSGPMQDTAEWLGQFDWKNSLALAHNAMFDGAIMSWVFGISPKGWLDTLSMARAVHGTNVGGSLKFLAEYYGVGAKGEEVVSAMGKRRTDFTDEQMDRYMAYCRNDVDLTWEIFNHMAPEFPQVELRLIDLTLRMFTEPALQLDKEVLCMHLAQVQDRKATLMDAIEIERDALMSNPKFADALRLLGVEPPMKISPTTGKETYAFAKSDEEFKALLEHENPSVQAIVAARLGVKSTLEETRTERFISIANRGPMPVPLRYYAAHTGRWGGCLVDDTEVTVYNPYHGVQTKRIVDVLADDLVWDGEEFVPHDGVVFSGYAEVIEWDGIKGTEDHVVFTDNGQISLRDAMQGAHPITTARSPAQYDVDAARRYVGSDEI